MTLNKKQKKQIDIEQQKLAQLRRCYAYCDCDASPSNSAACRLAADATWALAVTACSGLFGDPMEP